MTATRATAKPDRGPAEHGLTEIESDDKVATRPRPVPIHTAELIIELQSVGLRVEAPLERRRGGAGPTDSGMLWIEGVAVTVPTVSERAQAAPYALKWEDAGYGIYRDGVRLA